MIEFDGDGIPENVLIFSPHPDDSELGCGGTVSKWASMGSEVNYVICTNGDKGSNDPDIDSVNLACLRSDETKNASKVLGVKNLIELGYEDGFLEDTAEFREQIVKIIRIYKPQVVMVTDPVRHDFYVHRDHRIAGQVVLDALFPYARDRLYYPQHENEGIYPHKVKNIMFWGSEEPNSFVDITGHTDSKIEALLKHKSQISMSDSDNHFGDMIVEVASRAGRECGVMHAESFRAIEFAK